MTSGCNKLPQASEPQGNASPGPDSRALRRLIELPRSTYLWNNLKHWVVVAKATGVGRRFVQANFQAGVQAWMKTERRLWRPLSAR